MRRKLTFEEGKYAIYGGCILGGGGGGIIKEGLEKVEQTFKYGQPELVTIDEFQPDDIAVCVSLVGAPSAKEMFLSDTQLISTVQRMEKELNKPIKAIMTNENGAATTINGWLQAAALGLPFLDAPSNGRAHPTGSMGAMNLSDRSDYTSIQSFAGGKDKLEVSGIVSGSLSAVASTMRDLSVKAGGLVAVCRNPIHVGYIKENAAVGGITQAIELGRALCSANEGHEKIGKVVEFLQGEILHQGVVSSYSLEKKGGFDVGVVHVDELEMTFWNEYMTAELNEKRVATFPDLIMTLDVKTGLPIVTAEMVEGQEIAVLFVPKESLLLSSTMYNRRLLQQIEPIINKSIL